VRRVRRIFSLDAEAGRADHDLGRAARRTAIRALARAVADRTVDLSQVGGPPALVDSLAAIPAMTAATAHRLAMRLGEPDAFPSGNPALLQALSVITGHPAEAAEAERIAGRWRPRRAHAATHLLLSAAGTPRPSWAATSPPD
jgi:AraC family transcriptional regulator, regulatory protein of adaptative response / DNA-3-methyladenine glycosylase II